MPAIRMFLVAGTIMLLPQGMAMLLRGIPLKIMLREVTGDVLVFGHATSAIPYHFGI